MSSRFWNSSFFNSPFDSDPFFNTGINERQQLNSNVQQQSNSNLSQQQQQQQQQPQQSDTTLQTRPSQQHLWGGRDSWLSPFGRSSSFFDEPFGDIGGMVHDMNHMMNRMNRIIQQSDLGGDRWPALPDTADASSYSCSSSSFSQTGADGQTISRETRNERRRVGDLLEEQTHFKDSNGNERSSIRRGVKDQLKETIIDKNSKGEERKVENLKGLKPEEVQQFDQKWAERVAHYDPQHRLLGQQQQQPLISSGQRQENPRLTATPATKLESGGDTKPVVNTTSQTRTQNKQTV